MYFDDFNKLAYDFKTGLDDSKELVFVKDITQNIRFRKEFFNSLSLYNAYTIVDGETPEIISEKVYGTPFYHWVIMLANDRYDHINDFPLDGNKLGAIIETRYGDRHLDVHHFEDLNRKQIPGYQIISLPNTYLDEENTYLYDIISTGMLLKRPVTLNGVADMYTGIIESINTEDETINVLILKGGFRTADPIDIIKYVQDTSGNNVEQFVTSFYVTGDINYPYNVVPVTNTDYEFALNESKRNIRIVPKAYLDQIMTEFSGLMKK